MITLDAATQISDVDNIALLNDLFNVNEWRSEALAGEIHKCKTLMDRRWRPILDADPEVASVPADVNARVKMIVARADYGLDKEKRAWSDTVTLDAVTQISGEDNAALLDVFDDVNERRVFVLANKITRCKERMDKQWRPIFDADPSVDTVPTSIDERILMISVRPDYKNRAGREAEGQAAI